MKTVIALAAVAVAALTFSSCTCPACGGSGLQVRTKTGLVPFPTGAVPTKDIRTEECVPCKGTGVQGFRAIIEGLDKGLKTAETFKELSGN